MEKIITQLVEKLKHKKVSHFKIQAYRNTGTSISSRMLQLENNVRYQNQGIELSIVNNKKLGVASTVDFSNKGLDFIINSAVNLAKFSSQDKYNTLAPEDLMAKENLDLDLYYPYQLSKEEGLLIAKECEQAALDCKHITNSEGAEVSSFAGYIYYINSYNILMKHKYTMHTLSCAVIANNKTDMQVAYDYDKKTIKTKINSPQLIGKNAADKALAKLNPQIIKSGKYPVIFASTVSSSLIATIISALTGVKQYKKASFLLNSMGSAILAKNISIRENPRKKIMNGKFFDNDGVLKHKQFFVKDGVVNNYVLNQYYANKLGLQTTANAGGVNNLEVMTNKSHTLSEVIKGVDKGIIIYELMGQAVNIVTGDYSRGASGFMIEKGKITYPVAGITVAANLTNMLKNIVMIANDIDERQNIKVGSILVQDMIVSGS